MNLDNEGLLSDEECHMSLMLLPSNFLNTSTCLGISSLFCLSVFDGQWLVVPEQRCRGSDGERKKGEEEERERERERAFAVKYELAAVQILTGNAIDGGAKCFPVRIGSSENLVKCYQCDH